LPKKQIAWNRGIPHSEEAKLKMKEAAKNRKPVSKETREKMSEAHKGRKKAEEHREKIRLSNLGKNKGKSRPHKEETKKKIGIANKGKLKGIIPRNKGKKMSEESKKKIGNANRGRVSLKKGVPITEEQKIKIGSTLMNLSKEEYLKKKEGGDYYSPDWKTSLKEIVRDRDNHVCQLCGLHEKENRRKLDVHHLDYNKKNCSFTNLISLCRKCHAKTNSNRENFKKFFLEKLNLLIDNIK